MNRLLRFTNAIRYSYKLTKSPVVASYSTISWKSKRYWKLWFGWFGASLIIVSYYRYKVELSERIFNDVEEILGSSDSPKGKADIGGEFNLIDHNGVSCTRENFKNKWLLIYFGFCHCPDICPDQLEKMMVIVDKIDNNPKVPNLLPLFVSVDPERDTPAVVAKYIAEFSSKMVGLTGKQEDIANMAKLYKVFYKAGPKDHQGDYIVDHAIIMFLVGPLGEFLQYFGTAKTIDEIYAEIISEMRNYNYG